MRSIFFFPACLLILDVDLLLSFKVGFIPGGFLFLLIRLETC